MVTLSVCRCSLQSKKRTLHVETASCLSICDLTSVTKLFTGFLWNSLQGYIMSCWASLNFMKIGPVTLILYWRHKWISTYSFHISWPIFMWFSVEDPHITLVSSSEFVKHSALKGRLYLRAKIKFCLIFTSVADVGKIWCRYICIILSRGCKLW